MADEPVEITREALKQAVEKIREVERQRDELAFQKMTGQFPPQPFDWKPLAEKLIFSVVFAVVMAIAAKYGIEIKAELPPGFQAQSQPQQPFVIVIGGDGKPLTSPVIPAGVGK